MKKLVFIFILFSQVFYSQTPFEKGNALYQQGKYNEAINFYQGILNDGKESAEVYFNLGNCYYKLNKVAPAIYNFEMAKKLDPDDKEIENNLEFAQKMTIDAIQETPQVGFSKILTDFTSSLHYDTWAWLAIVSSFLVLICFLGYYFSGTPTIKRISFSGMLLGLLFVLISYFAGIAKKNRVVNDRPAIVFDDVTSVKSEPNASAQNAFVLHAGTKVQILETVNKYHKIKLADLKEGWVEIKVVKEIK